MATTTAAVRRYAVSAAVSTYGSDAKVKTAPKTIGNSAHNTKNTHTTNTTRDHYITLDIHTSISLD